MLTFEEIAKLIDIQLVKIEYLELRIDKQQQLCISYCNHKQSQCLYKILSPFDSVAVYLVQHTEQKQYTLNVTNLPTKIVLIIIEYIQESLANEGIQSAIVNQSNNNK